MRNLYLKILVVCLFAISANAQTTYYVKTDGTAGAAATSWSNASNNLQEVINAAIAGDKIFVAGGTYLPSNITNTVGTVSSRDYAFVLKNGVSVFGGFTGTEANENERTAGNLTVLSGDLAGNDVAETTANATNYMTLNKAENAYHVVLAIGITNTTIFDGFTITKGDASATTASTLTINGEIIDRRLGGGMYILNSGADFVISNVTATINRANFDTDGAGGGGGGFYINTSSPTIKDCVVTKNYSTHATPKSAGANYGSGMSIVLASSPTVTNTVFSENFGGSGGAVGINGGATNDCSPIFTNCTFRLNRGNTRAGAVDVRSSTPVFTACLFSENTAMGSGGGGVYNYSGRPSFLNNIFHKNYASTSNGAAYGSQNGNYGAVFRNNTFFDNRNIYGSTLNYSAGIFAAAVGASSDYPDKKTYLYNNLFFGSVAQYNSNKSTIDFFIIDPLLIGAINHNLIQQTAYTENGTNNKTNVNPLFINTTLGHMSFLAPGNASAAKDAGVDSENNTSLDFNGRARKNGTIDIGAVEYFMVLPVSFISFAAKATTNGVQLNWKVTSEINHKQYIISRSADGENYSLVTKVKGLENTIGPQSYSITDQLAAQGTYYYQLHQEDLDGTINYLATQVVKTGFSTLIANVYPNPAKDKVAIVLKPGVYNQYSLAAMQGNVLLNGKISNKDELINLNLSNLSSGIYIIKLDGANGSTALRVIKI
ncbi:T9SS type A sorting domain-containing protein [Pedobacter helvus]|uniref:T9SS type A sorting domain-containing protein n=1 Tax=Pedobacter helvus TaxID=2563444 RepID=A0ABW9JFL7_9SPHI|nr:T9SS type A sorting domain-containing protein [Pedobacter ureilyticus]